MRDPAPDELAAIAAAYLVVARRAERPAGNTPSRWRLAGRLPALEEQRTRFGVPATSRWRAAARSSYVRF